MTEGEADETMGPTDYIEAANGRNGTCVRGPPAGIKQGVVIDRVLVVLLPRPVAVVRQGG